MARLTPYGATPGLAATATGAEVGDDVPMRVMFTSSPGRGHIHPMVPLAEALVQRGDDVLWATGAQECDRLQRDGFQATPAGLDERARMAEYFRRYPEIQEMRGEQRDEYGFPRLFGTVNAAPMFTDLLPAARTWQPDLLVAEQAEFAGPLVAAALGVPNVCHGFGSITRATKVANAGERVAHLWVEQGLEPKPYGGCYEHLYINIYPPSLHPESTAHLGTVQDLGPGNTTTSGNEHLPDWVTADAGNPLVYVTFGTVFRNDAALVAIIEALREMPVRVVVTVGPQGDPAALGEQPGHVHVARYIPQAQLIPHCAAVVSHGGSGIFLAALMAGLPQLCVPQGADQFVNAAACVRAGAGLAIEPEDVNTDALRAAADRLFNEPSFRTRAEDLGKQVASMPTPSDVADRLHRQFS